ncbi:MULTISPECIES: hypothetical protein [Fusobacterium]|uniref:hypothetical protein n=1 Tax=Fusobacterium TaxID=848 RepID=UPI002A7F999F|nr:hypothetical protein [Fusobacterium sp.]
MIEIIEEHGEIEIFKSYSKYIKFYKIYCLFFVLLVSFITLKFTGIFFNFLSIIFIIGYIYISLFCISTEKIIIKEDYLIIQALNNNEKVLYSKKILLEEVKKVYFKNTFGISLMLDPGILNYLFNSKQKFMKIEAKKNYSFGLFLDYNDFLKIDAILQPKIKEHKDKKIILNKYKRKQEKLFKIYNLEIEERYKEILNIILNEKKIFLSKKDSDYIVNGGNGIKDLEIFKNMNFEEIDFYIFYVNYLSKKEYENKKVLVGYNGIDEKEVTMSKLKEDINKIRDSRSIFK